MVNFASDKTVQRRGWTAAVNVYNCNYPHLEDKNWRAKEKKPHAKKVKELKTTTTTTTTTSTTTTTTAFTTIPATTIAATFAPTTIAEFTTKENNVSGVAEITTTTPELEPASNNVEYSSSINKKREESFDKLEDRLSVTLNRLQNWAKNITTDRRIDVQILETNSAEDEKDAEIVLDK